MTCPSGNRDSGCIPTWSIGTWIYIYYPGVATDQMYTKSFVQETWMNTIQTAITNYNSAQISETSKITQIYPYGTDMELPWVSPTYNNNGAPLGINPNLATGDPTLLTADQFYDANNIVTPFSTDMPVACSLAESFCEGSSTCPITCDKGIQCPCPTVYWSLSDPTLSNCEYGFNFATSSSSYPVSMNINIPEKAVIIDARIDNGYLQGFNEFISIADAQNMAKLIVNGGYSQGTQTLGIGAFGPNSANKPTVNGIQLDFEPFDSSNPNQAAFYTQIGALLKATGQYYSIFTFPKAMSTTTATILNSSDNAYMIIALYDLLDMKEGIPSVCNADYTFTGAPCDTSAAPPPVVASGDATTAIYDATVPHSLVGYYNAVLLTVKQTIAKAAITGIKYKFGIPVSSSAHEFEGWGQYVCQFNNFIAVKPVNAFCRMYNGLPMNTESGAITQLGYVQMAIKAMQDGISQMGATYTNFASLFRGIDLYAFSYRTVWTPQNPVVDYLTGNVYYGNTPVYEPADANGVAQGGNVNPPYIYSTPSYPTFSASDFTNTQNILNWMATYGVDPRPQTCGSGTGICLPSQCNTSTNTCCPAGQIVVGSGTCCSTSNICGTGAAANCCPSGKKCVSGSCQ